MGDRILCPRCGLEVTATYTVRGTERIHRHRNKVGDWCRHEEKPAPAEEVSIKQIESELFAKDLAKQANALVANWYRFKPSVRICELKSISATALNIASVQEKEDNDSISAPPTSQKAS